MADGCKHLPARILSELASHKLLNPELPASDTHAPYEHYAQPALRRAKVVMLIIPTLAVVFIFCFFVWYIVPLSVWLMVA